MRTYAQARVLITKDSDQLQKLVDQTLQFDDNDGTRSAKYSSELFSLAALAADVQVPFGSITSASLVLIVAYDDITVKFNGTGSPAIPVRKTAASISGSVLSNLQKYDQPGVVVWRGKVDSIYLGNLSATAAASAFVAVVGDAT